MNLSWPQKRYVRRYVGEFNDRPLAEALGVERKVVTDYRRSLYMLPTRNADRGATDGPPAYTGQLPVPRIIHRIGRNQYLAAAVTALVILAVYTATLPPTVSGEDSGELITAAYTLGIPHPPGYPAWCILAHPFTYLPFGTIAWRVALSSAVFGAGAAFFVALTTIKLTGSRLGACAAALLFAFSKDAWEQSIIAEVYALNVLFIAACVLLLIDWYETRRSVPLLVFAFLYGLSLANHSTTRLLGPAFLLFVLVIDPVPWKRWKLYGACIGLSVVGLSAFLYLPIRSLADPPMDWGNPETWDNYWAVVRQEQFSFLLTQNERSFGLFIKQVGMFFDYFRHAFTPYLVVLPLLGLYPLWKSNRFLFWFVAGLTLLLSIGLVLALNYGTDRIAVVVNNVFFIPFAMMAAMFVGVGLAWIATLRIRGVTCKPAALALGVACAVLPLTTHYRANDKSSYYFAYDYAKNMLDTLEPNAVYLPAADHATFPVIYLQSVEGLRPDVTIGNKYGYPEEHFYADMPAEIRSSFRRIPGDADQRFIEEWIISQNNRPIYFTEKRGFPPQMNVDLKNAGLALRVVHGDEDWAPEDFWARYTWHSLDLKDAGDEFTARIILADYHFARGRDYLASGDVATAREAFDASVAASDDAPEALNNVGTAFAESGMLAEASEFYLNAVEADPNYLTGLRNLGQVSLGMQNFERAALVLKRLTSLEPRDMPGQFAYVASLKALEQYDDARDRLAELAQSRPDDPRVYRELGMLFMNNYGDTVQGRQYLMRSYELDPGQTDLATMLSDPRNAMPSVPGLPDLPGVPGPTSGPQGPAGIPGLPAPSLGSP